MKSKNYSITKNNRHITIYIAYLGGSTIYPDLNKDKPVANKLPSNSSGSVIFDGRDDSGEALRIGIYIIFLEETNEGNDNGFSKMIIPTPSTLVAVLAIAKVPYAKWLKFVVPWFAMLFLLSDVFLILVVIIQH